MMKNKDLNDDGRVVANMNVEGMPWYQPESIISKNNNPYPETMTNSQMRSFIWGAIKAGLLLSIGFSAALILFILFCLKVWFRV